MIANSRGISCSHGQDAHATDGAMVNNRAKSFCHALILSFAAMFLCLTAKSIRADDFVAGYHLEGKFLLLGQNMRNADGTLKTFSEMTPDEIATIYHELWHAWFLENRSSRRNLLHDRFQIKSNQRYAAYPEEKRLEIHEEAVADFIDAVIGTTVQMRRFVLSKPPDRRRQLLSSTNFQNIYTRVFQDDYTGYYTRSIRTPGMKSPESGNMPTSATGYAWNLEDNPALSHFVMNPERVMSQFIDDAESYKLPVRYLGEAVRSLEGVVFLSDIGLPIAAVPKLRATPPVSPNPSEFSSNGTAAAGNAQINNTGIAEDKIQSADDGISSQTINTAPTASAGDTSPTPPTNSSTDPVGRAAGGLLSVFLGGNAGSNTSLLQSDIVASDISLDKDDKALVEKYLFEGKISPEHLELLGQE